MNILIVKTSSLGDVIQSFPVLNALHEKFPGVAIDWVVESSFAEVLQRHPLVRRVIVAPMRELKKHFFSFQSWVKIWKSVQELRKTQYDCVFDLQGNCKSGLWTLLSLGGIKVGFDLASVREWPNIFSTHKRFFVPKEMNIQQQYLFLVSQHYQTSMEILQSSSLALNPEEKEWLESISLPKETVMVCPGSKWENKKLSVETWASFLNLCALDHPFHFFLVWGSLEERQECEKIHDLCKQSSVLDRKLSIPLWQNLMDQVSCVVAIDSSALHLCSTTQTRSFSIFGPTLASVFKPAGSLHETWQSSCPYGRAFIKQCPALRTCSTGACMKDVAPQQLFKKFIHWYKSGLHHLSLTSR